MPPINRLAVLAAAALVLAGCTAPDASVPGKSADFSWEESFAAMPTDYNGNTAALDAILADLAAQPVGSDADAVVSLSFINEWDRSLPAIQRHFVRSDGAGSIARVTFWMLRAYLFPADYRKFQASSTRASSTQVSSGDRAAGH